MVECDLAKVEVAGSNPVSRSNFSSFPPRGALVAPWRRVGRGLRTVPECPASQVRSAPSPSGKAEVCKTSTPGSNPGGASKFNPKYLMNEGTCGFRLIHGR